jgi:hypothetical protein
MTTAAPEEPPSGVVGHREEVGARAADPLQATGTNPEGREDLLHYVLSVGLGPGSPQREAVQLVGTQGPHPVEVVESVWPQATEDRQQFIVGPLAGRFTPRARCQGSRHYVAHTRYES